MCVICNTHCVYRKYHSLFLKTNEIQQDASDNSLQFEFKCFASHCLVVSEGRLVEAWLVRL